MDDFVFDLGEPGAVGEVAVDDGTVGEAPPLPGDDVEGP